jgi:hypothetical protein
VIDGVCYSSCSLFTKTVIDTRSARVLGYGSLLLLFIITISKGRNPTIADNILERYPGGSCGGL